MDELDRYRRYLLRFGIADPGERLARLDFLDRGALRAFAYEDGGRLRFRAIATPDGLVRPGWNAGDDWHGLLRESVDGETVAAGIAWLEEVEPLPGAFPADSWRVLLPGGAAAGVDPALLNLVRAPELAPAPASGSGALRWRAFLLPPGGPPIRCTVTAQAGAPAEIVREDAGGLLAASGEKEDAPGRARRLLVTGNAEEKEWALGQVAATRDPSAWPLVASLLAAPGEPGRLRIAAAATLADSADAEAFAPLAAALRGDADPAVRRAGAQALARLGGAAAAGALGAAWRAEPEPLVRAEIVHALAAIGLPGRGALAAIAANETDAAVAALAAHHLATSRPATTDPADPARGHP